MQYQFTYEGVTRSYIFVADDDAAGYSIQFYVYDDDWVIIDGFVKWDGCSNWNFNTENCMLHFCDKDEAAELGKIMALLYEIAHAMMKRHRDLDWDENYENILSQTR